MQMWYALIQRTFWMTVNIFTFTFYDFYKHFYYCDIEIIRSIKMEY